MEKGQWQINGNRTEGAMLKLAAKMGADIEKVRQQEQPERIICFSSQRKRMSVLCRPRISNQNGGGKLILYSKGAAEIMLTRCTRYLDQYGQPQLLSDELRSELLKGFGEKDLRILCSCYRELDSNTDINCEEFELEKDLILISMLGMRDTIRPEVPAAIQGCKRAGIDVKMLTGDNIITATAIAKQVGILEEDCRPVHMIDMCGLQEVDETTQEAQVHQEDFFTQNSVSLRSYDELTGEPEMPLVLEGKQFRSLVMNADGTISKPMFRNVWRSLKVLARCSPTDKYVMVTGCKLLKEDEEEIVAMTGDGTNDAPALRMADVGFAMNTGTSIAKEASDILIMDDNFNSILEAVKWGRNVYANIIKFLQFQLTINGVAVTTAFVGAAVFEHSPLTAVQMLWVNLIMDSLASLSLATERPTDDMLDLTPFRANDPLINKFVLKNMVGQGVYQLAVMYLMVFQGGELLGVEKEVQLTMVFNVFVQMQLFNQINCRKIFQEKSVLNLPNVQQTEIIQELLIGDEDDDENDLLFGTFATNEDDGTVDEARLIQEFRTQCVTIRGGIQGDLTKAFKDRKSLIVEGLHLDPGLYLSEFGVDGIKDVSVPEEVQKPDTAKQQQQQQQHRKKQVQRQQQANGQSPFEREQKQIPVFQRENQLLPFRSSPIMIRSSTSPDFAKVLNMQTFSASLSNAVFLLKQPSPDLRSKIPSPKFLRQLSTREAERSLRSAYLSIRKSVGRLKASTSLRSILISAEREGGAQENENVPMERKKSFSDGEREIVKYKSGSQTMDLYKYEKDQALISFPKSSDDKRDDKVFQWIANTEQGNLYVDRSEVSRKLSQSSKPKQSSNRSSSSKYQRKTPRSSIDRNPLSRLRQSTFNDDEIEQVVENPPLLERHQSEDNNYLADADSSADKSEGDDKDSNSGDEVLDLGKNSLQQQQGEQQLFSSLPNGMRHKIENDVHYKKRVQKSRNLYKQELQNVPSNQLREKPSIENLQRQECEQGQQCQQQSEPTQEGEQRLQSDPQIDVKNNNDNSFTLFVPIVLSMSVDDHRALAEEWYLRRQQRLPQQQPFNDSVAGGQQQDSQGQEDRQFECVFRRMRVLQEYLEAYKHHGVPVVKIEIGRFRDALDRLHEYLLQCIEMNVCRQGLRI
eukprot:TRINITY_DN2273_c0_g1_i9.p1 TRINITY_DN2273_c0_g1~~TRINITY_DN2273_c0_g1_i9.p1  ORF type:complete len:1144 (-),score=201.51 TRINITY_DN2273_c0_g1_i9:348-3779(-)